jgi:hypothetical protein
VDGNSTVVRFLEGGVPINRAELIKRLVDLTPQGFGFRALLNSGIADIPLPAGTNGVQIKFPVINAATANMPIYFVAVPDRLYSGGVTFSDYLNHCDPSPVHHITPAHQQRFWRFFALEDARINFIEIAHDGVGQHHFGAAIFKGGYGIANPAEIMVSPCPKVVPLRDAENQFLGHIYTFAHAVKNEAVLENSLRLHSFWYSVGKASEAMFDGVNVFDIDGNIKENLFLNTHGLGVPYLHFRVENRALHYNNVDPALRDDAPSAAYLVRIFGP